VSVTWSECHCWCHHGARLPGLDTTEPCYCGHRDVTPKQPPPTGNGTEILPLVLADLQARSNRGMETYGTRLRANNGRDALWDAYEEALDQACYLRQAIEERDHGATR